MTSLGEWKPLVNPVFNDLAVYQILIRSLYGIYLRFPSLPLTSSPMVQSFSMAPEKMSGG